MEIEEETVDLKDLLAFSKNPLKVYVNKVLGIYLDKDEDRIVKDEGDFFLSDLNAYFLTKQGLFGSKEATLRKAEKSGLIPPGPFKEIGSQKIEREIDQYLENFESYGIDLQKIFSIECLDHYQEPEFSDKLWKLPPLIVEIPSIGKIKMVGCIENVYSKGLILFSEKNNDKKLLEKWPSCLFLNSLIEAYNLAIEPHIIFVKGIKNGIRKIQDSQTQTSLDSLTEYLEYYLSARKGLSPLTPDWVKLIISGNVEGLKDVLKKKDDDRFQPITDQYDQWLKRNSPNIEMESSIAHWQPKAKKLFINVLEKKTKKKIMSVNEGEDE
jgi:exonuclease V gamma subunit